MKDLRAPETDLTQTRPARRAVPTSKLTDANNSEKPELSFQRKAVDEFRSRQVQEAQPPSELPGGTSADARPTNVGVSLSSDGIEGPGMSICLLRWSVTQSFFCSSQ